MAGRWTKKIAKFNALEVRERALLLGALISCVSFIWYFIFLIPIQKSIDASVLIGRTSAKSIMSVTAELTVLESAAKKDPDADLRRELEQLQSQLNALDGDLDAMAVGLIKAADLPVMLQQLLMQTQTLTLLSLATLPVETMDFGFINEESVKQTSIKSNPEPSKGVMNKAASASPPDILAKSMPTSISIPSAVEKPALHLAQLYKHGVEVKLEGSYSATYTFIKALENSHWSFYWESLDYQVTEYPNASMTLMIFTLASDKGIFDQRATAL